LWCWLVQHPRGIHARLDGTSASDLMQVVHVGGIVRAVGSEVGHNQQTAYRHLCQRPTPIAAQLAQEVMSLPMSPDLTHAQQDEVVHEVALAIQNNA